VDNTADINTDLNNPDTSKMGYFTGKVSDRLYLELVAELKKLNSMIYILMEPIVVMDRLKQ
jgi:hypothetical protein